MGRQLIPGDFIVGPAVFIGPADDEGWTTDVPDRVIHLVRGLGIEIEEEARAPSPTPACWARPIATTCASCWRTSPARRRSSTCPRWVNDEYFKEATVEAMGDDYVWIRVHNGRTAYLAIPHIVSVVPLQPVEEQPT